MIFWSFLAWSPAVIHCAFGCSQRNTKSLSFVVLGRPNVIVVGRAQHSGKVSAMQRGWRKRT